MLKNLAPEILDGQLSNTDARYPSGCKIDKTRTGAVHQGFLGIRK